MEAEEQSMGEWTTLGRKKEANPAAENAVPPEGWDPEKSLGEQETLKGGGIADDGRTDGARRWKAGEEILGRYVVERELGQGGMGVVYGCLDKVGGVRVAVKCLPPELSHNSVEMEEVRENFQLVYGLSHPNIAGVRQLERDEHGEYYLVMEEAVGENLRRWLRAKWKSGGVTLAEATAVLRQVAAALDYAHGKKVVHRDVKPGNVMIDGKGEVKVLDFGLADQIRTSLSRASHAHRETSGTGPYMSPEQWRGRPQDGKTDQYALGVMAYEMLAGRLPFGSSDLGVLREMVLKEEPAAIPGLPESAMGAIRRAMAKSAGERFGSCGEFVEALEGKGKDRPTVRPGQNPDAATAGGHGGAGAGAGGRRNARGRTLMGWVVALALAGAVGVWWKGSGGRAGGKWEEGKGNAVEETVRPEGSPHQQEAEAARKATEERLAAERKAAAEARQAAEKAAAEEAARWRAEREQAAWEAAEAQQKAQEAERRAQEAEAARKAAEAARKKAEEDAARRQREWDERLAKLEEKVSPTAVRAGGTEVARPEGSPHQQGSHAGERTTVRVGAREVALRWCPADSFTMGSPAGEVGRDDDETQHRVTLTQGFWMGETEVTQGLWREVTGENPAYFKNGDDYPVESVSWNDCQKFLQALNSRYPQEGLQWALPTEAQWEYACRAGTVGDFAGTGNLGTMGWHTSNSGGKTHPVGQKEANAWGLYDMHGNVWEWCADWYGAYPSGSVEDPKGSSTGSARVDRGGSWGSSARYCRSSVRFSDGPGFRRDSLGLRVALLPVQ